jgi:hypothetical protein
VVIVAALLCLLCASVLAEDESPATGSVIKNCTRSGLGTVLIHNEASMDVVAALTSTDLTPLIAVYIRSKDTYSLSGIDDGTYSLYFTMGTSWVNSTGRFESTRGLYHFSNPLVFDTTENADDVEYSAYEVNLYEVPLGKSNIVPANFDFPNLASAPAKSAAPYDPYAI